jgi:hypothetical protein
MHAFYDLSNVNTAHHNFPLPAFPKYIAFAETPHIATYLTTASSWGHFLCCNPQLHAMRLCLLQLELKHRNRGLASREITALTNPAMSAPGDQEHTLWQTIKHQVRERTFAAATRAVGMFFTISFAKEGPEMNTAG